MNDYKKKYLKYKKKYLQAKNIYGGMDPGYEWNCEGYFEDLEPDLSKYIDSETKWDEEWPLPYPVWEDEKEWKLSQVTNLDDNERFGSGAYVFGYYTNPSSDIISNPLPYSPYAEIIFTTPESHSDGPSRPYGESNKTQREVLKKVLSRKGILNKNYSEDIVEHSIINMHMLNAQLGGFHHFTTADSNSQENLVLGSAQANTDHKYYERTMIQIAWFLDRWNKANTNAKFKLAVQTSIYFPNQFNKDNEGHSYSYKGFIIRLRLVKINTKTGIVTPEDPREIVKLFEEGPKKWYCDDMGCIDGPIDIIERNYALFNKYGSYVMINWDEDKFKESMLEEIHRILEEDSDCYKKLKIKNKNKKQLLSKIHNLYLIYHPDKFHYNEQIHKNFSSNKELATEISKILEECKRTLDVEVDEQIPKHKEKQRQKNKKKQQENICWHCEEPIEVGDMIRCGPTNDFKYELFHERLEACKLKYHKECYDEIGGYENTEGHFCKLECLKTYANWFKCCEFDEGMDIWVSEYDQDFDDLGIPVGEVFKTYNMLQTQISENEPKLYERVKKEFEEFEGILFTGKITEKYEDYDEGPLWHIEYPPNEHDPEGDCEDMNLQEVESAHKLHNSIESIVAKASTNEELAYIAYREHNGNINKAVNAIKKGIIN